MKLKDLEFFLQAVNLCPQGVNDVLPVFQHEILQLLGGLHLLNVLHEQQKHTLNLDSKDTGQQYGCMYNSNRKK